MLFVSYDISDDKVRASFARFLNKYGHRFQYSVYELRNSQRVLRNIQTEIEKKYAKCFTGADSILIFGVCEGCKNKVVRYGFAQNDEKDVVVFS